MPHASWASTRSFGSAMATGAALGEKCAITHTRALCGCWGCGTGPRFDVGVPRSCVGRMHAGPGVSARPRPSPASGCAVVRSRSLVAATGAASWMAPWPLHTRYRYHWVRSCRGYLHAKSGSGLQVQCLGAISAPNVPLLPRYSPATPQVPHRRDVNPLARVSYLPCGDTSPFFKRIRRVCVVGGLPAAAGAPVTAGS